MNKIPKEWRIAEIKQLLKEGIIEQIQDGNHGSSHPVSTDFVVKGIPFVMANCFNRNKLNLNHCYRISVEQYKKLRIGFSKSGDVLLTHKGTVGLTAVVEKQHGDLMLTPQVTYYRIGNKQKLLNYYLFYFFQSSYFQERISKLSVQSTRAYIGITEQKNLSIILPTINEQQKIARILSSVDKVIELVEIEIKSLQNLKQGMMQNLLTKGIGHKKFKNTHIGRIPETWRCVDLEDCSDKRKFGIVDGPFGSSINTAQDYVSEGVPVIRTLNIRPYKFLEDDLQFISEEKFSTLTRSAVYPGDVLLSKVGTIGYACIFPNHLEKAMLSTTGSCKITVDSENVSNEYLCYYLNYLKPEMDKIASEGVQPFLNMTTIKGLQIALPTKEEQQMIVNCLNSILSKIRILEEKLVRMINVKKGLMQDLVTGNLRINV